MENTIGTKKILTCYDQNGCDTEISDVFIKRIINDEHLKKRYFRILVNIGLDTIENLHRCPICENSLIIEGDVTNFPCEPCGKSYCMRCGKDSHHGTPCQTLLDIETEKQIAKVAIACLCGKVITKGEGCNHLTCVCGREWCWKCKGVYRVCQSQCVVSRSMDFTIPDQVITDLKEQDPFYQAEQIRLRRERIAAEAEARIEQERLARLERERLERELSARLERERLERERVELERFALERKYNIAIAKIKQIEPNPLNKNDNSYEPRKYNKLSIVEKMLYYSLNNHVKSLQQLHKSNSISQCIKVQVMTKTIRRNNPDIIKVFLQNMNFDASINGNYLLKLAIELKRYEIIKILLHNPFVYESIDYDELITNVPIDKLIQLYLFDSNYIHSSKKN
jgi:hypothetical protein